MSITINKNTRAFILGMIALSFVVITVSYFYYKNINSSKDPRVKTAREIYKSYNEYATQNDFEGIFNLLDSVEFIYKSVPHYKESFEIGVLYNNRSAAYLTMAIYNNRSEAYSLFSKDSLLKSAQSSAHKSISIYESWLNEYENIDTEQIRNSIKDKFIVGLDNYSVKDTDRFLNARVKEIETAQYETKRRLSVAYTNLGIIYRHFEDYENAIKSYQKAIELWDQNLSAENNYNILLGKPLKKRNLIQKLFPPKRKEN